MISSHSFMTERTLELHSTSVWLLFILSRLWGIILRIKGHVIYLSRPLNISKCLALALLRKRDALHSGLAGIRELSLLTSKLACKVAWVMTPQQYPHIQANWHMINAGGRGGRSQHFFNTIHFSSCSHLL